MIDPSKRPQNLEREVARLTEHVRDLERQRDALLRDARNRHADAAPKQHSWIGRLILLSLTAAAGSAAFFMFRSEDFSFAQLTALGSDVAAMDTDTWLLACVLCIGAAMVFYISHRRFLFGFAALSALYGTHWAYFAKQPAALNLSEQHYFWVSTALLTGAYALLAYLSVHECRRSPRGRRGWAVFALVNSAAFFATVWPNIQSVQPDHVWLFRLFFALLLTGFAVLAETRGPHRNPVFQLYVAKAVLMTNLALAVVLDGHWYALVLAAECVCLALTYRQSGFILFKLINVIVLAAAVIYGSQLGAPGADETPLSQWGTSAAMAVMLLIAAAIYTHGMRERTPEARRTSGHWSYADTALNIRVAKLSTFHAAGATLILIATALFNLSENELLPFSLAGAAVALIMLGALSKTPAVEFAGILVLASAQAAYGYSLVADTQGSFDASTMAILVAGLTAVSIGAAWRWDHTVRNDKDAGALEYVSSIAAPYIAAGLMAAAFTLETIIPEYAAAAQHAAALTCLLAFRRWHSGGMRIFALTLILTGAITFVWVFAWPALNGDAETFYWFWFAAALLSPLAAERILAYQFGIDRRPGADAARTVLVVLACLTGLTGLYCGTPESNRAWWWLAMAAVAAICGIAFREGRYRWSAMIALVAAAVLVAAQFAEDAQPANVYPFVAAAVVVCGILVASWGVAMRAQWIRQRRQGASRDEG